MKSFEFLKYMVDEEHNALEKLLDKMVDEDLCKPLIENEETTIGDRFNHILSSEYRMAGYLYETEESKFEFVLNSISEIRKASEISKRRHKLTLDGLSEDDLDKVWTSKISGNQYSYKFLIWHFIEHIATHRGQIATCLRRLKN